MHDGCIQSENFIIVHFHSAGVEIYGASQNYIRVFGHVCDGFTLCQFNILRFVKYLCRGLGSVLGMFTLESEMESYAVILILRRSQKIRFNA